MHADIFQKARIKLSLWYLAILACVSVIFSTVVFTSLNAELLRNARREQQRIVAEQMNYILPKPLPDPQQLPKELVNPPFTKEIQQAYISGRNALIFQLVIANIMVLGLCALASYFLAGKTLQPIEEMTRDQKQFVANASHELRTPLTALKTALEVTLKMDPIPYERTREILLSNLEDVVDLEMLSNSLLSFERYSYGFNDKHMYSLVQLDSVIQRVVSKLQSLAAKRHIHITTKTTPLSFLAEETSIFELVTILLDNAIKYNKDNGKVTIILDKEGNNARLTVVDTGVGIESDQISRIFHRFYRVTKGSTVHGHGLGLSIASQIVKMYRGEISVESTLHTGSTFSVLLPVRPSSLPSIF